MLGHRPGVVVLNILSNVKWSQVVRATGDSDVIKANVVPGMYSECTTSETNSS